MVWTRFAGYFLGNRVFAFSVLLAAVLLAMVWGAAIARRCARRFSPLAIAAVASLVSAAMLPLSGTATWAWVQVQVAIERMLPGFDSLALPYRAGEALLVTVPALLPASVVFPALLIAVAEDDGDAAERVGVLYLVNTVGAVVGSAAGGFLLIPWLGTFATLQVLAALSAAAGLAVLAASSRRAWGWLSSQTGENIAVVDSVLWRFLTTKVGREFVGTQSYFTGGRYARTIAS